MNERARQRRAIKELEARNAEIRARNAGALADVGAAFPFGITADQFEALAFAFRYCKPELIRVVLVKG
jgi:hypothetical protein